MMAENETNNNNYIDIVSDGDFFISPIEQIIESENILYEPILIDTINTLIEPVPSKAYNNTVLLDTIESTQITQQAVESVISDPTFDDLEQPSCPSPTEDCNACEQGVVMAEFSSKVTATEVVEKDIRHNHTQGLQGGNSIERFHISYREWQAVQNANDPSELNPFATVADIPAPVTGDKYYKHSQGIVSTTWLVIHGLNKYPSVTITDSAKNEVQGHMQYIDNNTVEITFSAPFSGYAEFN